MERPRDDAAQGVLRLTRAGASSLVTGAVATKLLNFFANVAVTRAVGRAALGVGSLRLDDFLFLGPLVLVREGLRKAAYRVNTDKATHGDARQSLVNMSWAAAPVTMVVTTAFVYSLLADTPDAVAAGVISAQRYHRAMACTVLAVVLSLIAEPMFVLAQAQLRTRARARIETWAVMGKCVAIVIGTVWFDLTIEAFAIANIVYALLVLLGYLALFAGCGARFLGDHYSRRGSGIIPRPMRLSDGDSYWDPKLMRTARMFWWQTAQKWLLENGEKVLLIFAGTDDQQDAYVVVSRLGSIVVRVLFQPAEEMSLAAFGKLIALERDQEEKISSGLKKLKKSRGSKLVTSLVHSTLRSWLLLLGLIGFTFAVFGPAFAHLALHLLYGASWSTTRAPMTLAYFSIYVLFMAVNGICEAFVQGTSTEQGLSRYNIWMILFSVLYIGAVLMLLPRFGAVGLVLANIFKMACRILVCTLVYIRPFFRERTLPDFELSSLLPARAVLLAYASSAVVLQCSRVWIYSEGGAGAVFLVGLVAVNSGGLMATMLRAVLHVGIGVMCLLFVGLTVAKSHRDVLESMFSREDCVGSVGGQDGKVLKRD